MGRFWFTRWVLLALIVGLFLAQQARLSAAHKAAPVRSAGAVILYTVPPRTVCVGDAFAVDGAAFISPTPAPAASVPLRITLNAALGSVAPATFEQRGTESYFRCTYTALRPGDETIKVIENPGLAADTLRFKVQSFCGFGATLSFLLDGLHQ